MKKLLLLFLLVAGGVSTAKADWPEELYLQCNENNEWAVEGAAYNDVFKFTKLSAYEFRATVPGSYIEKGSWYFRFRVKDDGWWKIGPKDADVDVTSSSASTYELESNKAFYVTQNASAKYIHIYCTYNSDHWEVSTETVTSETTYTIAFTNPSGWSSSNVKAYVFNDGYVRTVNTWPGDVMTYENGIYKISVTGSSTAPYVIFSNNGSDQTSNLAVVGDAVYNESGKIGNQSITINTYGKGTFCSQYPLDFSKASPSGLTAYRITGSNKATGVLTKAAVTKVPAGVGVYVEGTAGQEYTITPTATATSIGDNMLVGVTEDTAITTTSPAVSPTHTNYILTVNAGGTTMLTPKFYKVNSTYGNTVLANRAYLQIPIVDGARESFWFDDETTAIDAIKQEQKFDGKAFNLAGQRVAQPTKGLYIVNGKKVVK